MLKVAPSARQLPTSDGVPSDTTFVRVQSQGEAKKKEKAGGHREMGARAVSQDEMNARPEVCWNYCSQTDEEFFSRLWNVSAGRTKAVKRKLTYCCDSEL